MNPQPFEKQAFPSSQRALSLPLLLIIPLLVLFAISDAAVLKLMDVYQPEHWGAFWVYLTAGGMCAQFGLLVIWGALGLGNAWLRQVSIFLIASVWLASWFLGGYFLSAFGNYVSWRQAAPILCVPLILLASQLPLWVLRILGRWRLAHCSQPIRTTPPQMTIAGILGAMTFVGISLALGNVGLKVSELESPGSWWAGIGIACASGFAACVLVVIPVCCLALRLASWPLGLGLSALYLLLVFAAALFITGQITGEFRGGPFGTILAYPTTFSGLALGLLLPLMLIRLASYRLRWGKE